ncbi:hypothetical protein D5F01_LYC24141 [Larimichthys crocea]|uniref:Uncharacterized protein n=1 Tax=Larimichthys crocea TaxID=215358 RepID=A0A6G0HF28_LARCR|nr:hypothetical protein D5F01_LYC24141 [Larimichthys crocea]
MGSLTDSLSNHEVSSGFEDSDRRGARNPVEAHAVLDWSSDEDDIVLCPSECIMGSLSACHTEKERASPSRSTLTEFVLPLKIHFRYCWLFSGVPWHNTTRLGNRTVLLTDRELLYVNRTLMTGEESELCRSVYCDEMAYRRDMRAFWLTTDGRLVLVDQLCEDMKFRRLRQKNLLIALSLWTTDPELCGQTMRASKVAHGNLVTICGEAARLSRGRFHNLYANYPLPVNVDAEQNASSESIWLDEKTFQAREIRNGSDLLLEIQPLYTAYFTFLSDNSTSSVLDERVSLLGAQWLVQEDRSELQFSLNLRRNWFTRMVIRLALFLVASL